MMRRTSVLRLEETRSASWKSGLSRRTGRHRAPFSLSHNAQPRDRLEGNATPDRKSTRLNSSHGYISYAVFYLKKKKDAAKDTTTIKIDQYTKLMDQQTPLH